MPASTLKYHSSSMPEVTGQALPCGHYLAEELPDAVAQEALHFFSFPEPPQESS